MPPPHLAAEQHDHAPWSYLERFGILDAGSELAQCLEWPGSDGVTGGMEARELAARPYFPFIRLRRESWEDGLLRSVGGQDMGHGVIYL